MMQGPFQNRTVGEALLRLLASRGIEHVFANAGTDFAPLIEAWVRGAMTGVPMPKPITAPHENVAIAMALGHWMVSGRAQAVMVHVNVGTANTICGLLNAARMNAPILMMAGRTPITETGLEGSRNIHIHWTQEMFDQAGLVREAVKWDYELRTGVQVETVVDRALAVSGTAPAGPVYLMLPREVLAAPLGALAYQEPTRLAIASLPRPDPAAIEELARLFHAAERPVIVTSRMGFEEGGVAALGCFAERFAVPVVQYVPQCLCLPDSHPMHVGYDPAPWLREADLVVVLECAVPWIPVQVQPPASAKVVHAGVDPLYQRLPIRGFACDLAITATAGSTVRAVDAALSGVEGGMKGRIAARRARVAAFRAERRRRREALLADVGDRATNHPAWITHCIEEACGEDAILLREAPQFSLDYLRREHEGTFFSAGAAGGLGWGLGAAIGAKLAAPERLVATVVGDGSYMFGTPVAAHYAALEQKAPFLTVIMDNQRWNEVGAATRHLYPEGEAARNPALEPLTYFDKSLKLEKTVETVGGWSERVTAAAALPKAMERAVRAVKEEGRQAVLDVVCAG